METEIEPEEEKKLFLDGISVNDSRPSRLDCNTRKEMETGKSLYSKTKRIYITAVVQKDR